MLMDPKNNGSMPQHERVVISYKTSTSNISITCIKLYCLNYVCNYVYAHKSTYFLPVLTGSELGNE